MKNLIPLFIFFFAGPLFLNAQNTVEIEILNFKNDKGQALIGLYNSENNFLKEEYKGKMVKISNNKALLTFENLPDGDYAITVIHDEDGNEELTTNFLGIPKESIGASNDAPARFGPPKWEDAMFVVKNGETLKKKINLN